MTKPQSAAPSPAASTVLPSGPGSGVVLAPRPWVPLGTLLLGLANLAWLPLWSGALWLAGTIALFAAFLLLQSALLRLEFTDDSLLVWRQNKLLRQFSYGEWLSWRLFWRRLPVLFYFREQRSIHLLPMLFDADALRQQLQLHLSGLETGQASAGELP
jgi:hypothetical protein